MPQIVARALAVVLMAIWVASCAALQRQDEAAIAAFDGGGRRVTVLVATTRVRDASRPALFTSGRSPELQYARYVISIPPTHRPTEIETAAIGPPDPRTSFAIVGATPLSELAFRRAVSTEAPTARSDMPTAAVFVHGYNYTFQESLFRAAQVFADADLGGAQILFAWPSDGSPVGYLADRDAADFSRNDLSRMIDLVGSEPSVRRLAIVGHSMGSWLLMESLRQLRLTGRSPVFRKLQAVMLAAPDIDVDVFVKQLAIVGRTSPPLVILVAPDDGALALSGTLAGDRPRIGSADVNDPRVQEAARRFGVRVVDITSINTTGDLAHGRYAGIASLYPRLRQELESRTGGGDTLVLGSDQRQPLSRTGAAR